MAIEHTQPFLVDIQEYQSWPTKAQHAVAALLHQQGINTLDTRVIVFGMNRFYAWMLDRNEVGQFYRRGRHSDDAAWHLEDRPYQ